MTVASSSDFCMSNKFVAQVTGLFCWPSIVARVRLFAAQPPQHSGKTLRARRRHEREEGMGARRAQYGEGRDILRMGSAISCHRTNAEASCRGGGR